VHDVLVPHLAEKRSNPRKQSGYPAEACLVNIFTKFRQGHPCGGDKYKWGIKISRFFTNKSLYLPNDTR